jgi:hypothetical protein
MLQTSLYKSDKMLYVNGFYGPPDWYSQVGAALIPKNNMTAAVMHPFHPMGLRYGPQILNAPSARVLGHLS